MAEKSGVRYKADYIWETPDDGNRYEVIDGELYVTPPPSLGHQRGLSRLLMLIAPFVDREGLGEVFPAPTGVVLDPEGGVQPDLLFVRRERADILSQRGIEGPPDLVVEVLSPSTRARDRGIKMRRYERAGVPHYWLMDTEEQSIETYQLGAEGYRLTGSYRRGMVLTSELFPGLEIAIDRVWP